MTRRDESHEQREDGRPRRWSKDLPPSPSEDTGTKARDAQVTGRDPRESKREKKREGVGMTGLSWPQNRETVEAVVVVQARSKKEQKMEGE